MKKGIHPDVHQDAKTTCITCGAVYMIPTTIKEQQVEVCAKCHPVYTGEYRGVLASGRVDRFKKLQEQSAKKKQEHAAIKEKKAAKKPAAKAKKAGK